MPSDFFLSSSCLTEVPSEKQGAGQHLDGTKLSPFAL